MATPAFMIVRLIPTAPTDPGSFLQALSGIQVTLYERTVGDPSAQDAAHVIGTAELVSFAPPPLPPFKFIALSPSGLFATVFMDCTAFANNRYKEYRTSDLRMSVKRNGALLGDTELDYNVPWWPVPPPLPLDPAWFETVEAVARYFEVPPKDSLNLGTIGVPTDGMPPNFTDLKAAIVAVLQADPGTPVPVTDVEISKLTLAQCKHIAYEITWNRTTNPLPIPEVVTGGTNLAQMYLLHSGSKTDEKATDREKFLGTLAGYYAEGNAEADALTKYVYAVAMAVGASLQASNATKVAFSFAVLPGATSASGSTVATAQVTLTP